jgi:hypothetical protein
MENNLRPHQQGPNLHFLEEPMPTNDLQPIGNTLNAVADTVQKSFWTKGDFLLATFLGILGAVISGFGLYFSVKAFKEARAAKHAATEAGKTVKIQTVTIELSDILPKLDKLQPDVHFNEARDLLNEISRRLRRIISPFETDEGLSAKITLLRETLDKAKASLNNVRPTDTSKEEVPGTVYYAIEGEFVAISNSVADLLGLFEKKTIDFGQAEHANKSRN